MRLWDGLMLVVKMRAKCELMLSLHGRLPSYILALIVFLVLNFHSWFVNCHHDEDYIVHFSAIISKLLADAALLAHQDETIRNAKHRIRWIGHSLGSSPLTAIPRRIAAACVDSAMLAPASVLGSPGFAPLYLARTGQCCYLRGICRG